MTFVFSTWNSWASWLVSLATFSLWSHVEVQVADDLLIGAIYGQGVRRVSKRGRVAGSRKTLAITIPASLADAVRINDFLAAQEGKPYDLRGALGLALRRDWQDDDAWFCSELAAAALAHVDYPGVMRTFGQAWRVRPGALKRFLLSVHGASAVYLK